MKSVVRHFLELLWEITKKELQVRYKHTVFGFLWLIANPLMQMLVIGFVFPLFIKEPVKHYYYYLFAGLLAWNFFSLSLSKATQSIVFERSLIKKAVFPRMVIPISIVLSNLINFVIAFILFLIPVSFLQTLSVASAFYFLLGLTLLIIFTVGVTLLASSLNVKFRDINFFVQAILIVWFYATPVMYSLSQLPERFYWIWHLNPLTSIFQLIQAALVGSVPPEPSMMLANFTTIFIVGILGVVTFLKESKDFDDWL